MAVLLSETRNRPLTGRCGIITGAAGGIGRSLCEAFVSAGARVAVLDLESSRVVCNRKSARGECGRGFGGHQ